MNAVVIATTPTRTHWLENCHRSLMACKYPVIILSDYTYELGKIKFIYEHTNIDDFLLLHDSCEVKDVSFIDSVFNHETSVCLSDSPIYFGAYLGKYRREILKHLDIPIIHSKAEAIEQEIRFNAHYVAADMNTRLLFTDFHDCNCFEEKFGQKLMRIENKYLIKWKSAWNKARFKE